MHRTIRMTTVLAIAYGITHRSFVLHVNSLSYDVPPEWEPVITLPIERRYDTSGSLRHNTSETPILLTGNLCEDVLRDSTRNSAIETTVEADRSRGDRSIHSLHETGATCPRGFVIDASTSAR